MSDPHAYDMSRYQRIIGIDGGRVTGHFQVASSKRGEYHVKPVDVTVWADDVHRYGRVLYGPDLTAFVKNDVVDIPPYMVASEKRDDVLDAMPAVETAVRLVVAAFESPASGEAR